MNPPWKISPSDLTFLWDECPRCFYLKIVKGIQRPASAFPKIFSRIDSLMKNFFMGKDTQDLSPQLPGGEIILSGKRVSSQTYVADHSYGCFIQGMFDTVVKFVDGSYGIVDFKTTEIKPATIPFYSRQLNAYAYALEHPASGALSLSPISRLGLLCVEPVAMEGMETGQVAYMGNPTWVEIPIDFTQFLQFVDTILLILEYPDPPAANPDCTWCAYREMSRQTGY